jgi:hypothetical protein
MWVSTKIPWSDAGRGFVFASTTFAVLRAAPGTVVSSAIVDGTSPPKSSVIFRAEPMIDFVF